MISVPALQLVCLWSQRSLDTRKFVPDMNRTRTHTRSRTIKTTRKNISRHQPNCIRLGNARYKCKQRRKNTSFLNVFTNRNEQGSLRLCVCVCIGQIGGEKLEPTLNTSPLIDSFLPCRILCLFTRIFFYVCIDYDLTL